MYTVISFGDQANSYDEYIFPKRYLKRLNQGTKVLFHKRARRNKLKNGERLPEISHYFAQGVVDTVSQISDSNDYRATFSHFERFKEPVAANRTTWEKRTFEGVRPIDKGVYDDIIRLNQAIVCQVYLIYRDLSDKLARCIAENPKYLASIEWRELERVVQHTFEELGFDTILTPGSKDKGKDVILKCKVDNQERTYFVELKHWRSGKKVGERVISEFLSVVVNEEVSGGLLISSSGLGNSVYESITEIDRQVLKIGGEFKIYSMCKRYTKLKRGIWSPEDELVNILYENTF
ncbi:restriction endonuclease [Vibrio parahaemolyticus]|uniref:restriction endonuclease n=1 Tax=Vibrio parahaemolyticus TaxID=670 RepID=UPI001A31ADA0|nr:restriction endonuclease [Vibrio parahaemolyticus]MCX8764176.1 restriction endonuclease [Vibrio parahaemolyticus]HAS3051619.1 restriction endonuclease [Vibrio parahaemolyticus]